MTSIGDLHTVHRVLHKEIVMGATCSTADVLKYPLEINWKDASGTIPVDKKIWNTPQNHYSSSDWYWNFCPPNQHMDSED